MEKPRRTDAPGVVETGRPFPRSIAEGLGAHHFAGEAALRGGCGRDVPGHFPRAHHPSPALLDHPDILFRFDIVEIVVDDTGPTFNLIKYAFKLPEPYPTKACHPLWRMPAIGTKSAVISPIGQTHTQHNTALSSGGTRKRLESAEFFQTYPRCAANFARTSSRSRSCTGSWPRRSMTSLRKPKTMRRWASFFGMPRERR